MAKTLTCYFPLKVSELDTLVEAFKKEFDELIADTFSDAEMEEIERKLDVLAAVYVGPVLSELTFDDFSADEDMRDFFSQCKSTLVLENLPYLETNPFQVSWLELFLSKFSAFLMDPGDLSLQSKEEFLPGLKRFKNMDALIRNDRPAPPPIKHGIRAPVLPIDFLILDVYKEIDRLRADNRLTQALETVAPWEKARRIFVIMKEGRLDGDSILRLSGLGPKDFDDNLEKLKFTLRKV